MKLSQVSRFYGTVIGVGDINLHLPPGAYGLVGPNGSGKTTFINLITGVLASSLGSVSVFGKNPFRDRDVLKRIGLCPASDILYPKVTALQWVEYLTGLHGFSAAEARERAIQSLIRVGMEANMRRPIGSYSLGMRQRTKLAQATAHDPDLLILDEPFNGLDPIGRHELTAFLKEWVEKGRSLILASHILHEVEAITTSFLLIHGGRLLASGDASEVRSMLYGFPVEIVLGGTGLRQLAQSLAEEMWVRGIDISGSGDELRVQVSDKTAFQTRIIELANHPEIHIDAVESEEGGLEAAFDLLLRVHRGDLAVQ
ncbi:MAG: ABC transporter ATP-binding protein [Planctomycetota bacterium]|nr:ABC transporter ATP-binding protein [Planctomycetota bacterium]